jgi:hypothetical protein
MFSEQGLFDGGDDGTFVPFTDILLNVSMGLAIMVFVAFALIRPELEQGNIDLNADFLISMSWPDGHQDDIDFYVQDPGGNIAWYRNMEAGLLSLERDDRGMFRDTMVFNGERIENKLNQESVTLRGFLPGEYVVNVYHYVATGVGTVPVTVKVERLNPQLKVVYYGTIDLDHRGQEETVIRFTLDSEGNATDLNNRFKSLTQLARTRDPTTP